MGRPADGGLGNVPFRGRGTAGEQPGWDDHQLTGFGRFLRQAREYKGVSLREVERKTRIPRRHLHALESEDFEQLPPLIYARGIVRNYAQFLGLDPMDVLQRFEQSHGQRSGEFKVVPAVKTTEVPSHWAPNFAIIAFMVIMSAVIFAWMYSAYFAPPDPNGTTTEQAVETPEADQEVAVIEDDDDDDDLAEGGGESLLPLQRELQDEQANTDEEPEDDPPSAGEGGENSDDASEQQQPMQPSDAPDFNRFVISTSQSVWVHVTVDGEVVLDQVVQPGATHTLEGQTMTVNSGNAPYVNVSVNGENRGPVGEVWDATQTYP
jgi:cytoskeleton protein RodZ